MTLQLANMRTPTESRSTRMEPLARLPVFFALEGRRVLVAGGSAGAAWKVELLSASGAKVDVYAAKASDELLAVAINPPRGEIVLHDRAWTEADMMGAAIAVGGFEDDIEAAGFAEAARRMVKHGRPGSIINVASIAGLGGNPSGMKTLAYNTSKAAVINFTRALAGEWGEYGIRVNAICPGFFPSKMTAGTLKNFGEDVLASHAPLRRLGDDEDLKGLALLYASDAGKHITGQWLAVDGGVSCISGG